MEEYKTKDLRKSILNANRKIFFMCLLVFIFGLGFGAKAEAATYKVGVYSDLHYGTTACDGPNYPERVEYATTINNRFMSEGVSAALMLGDMIDNSINESCFQSQLATLASTFMSPTYWVVGNHDLQGETLPQFLTDASAYLPSPTSDGNFTFDLGNWRFINISGVGGCPEDANGKMCANANTLTWLATTLSNARTAGKYIVIAMHTAAYERYPGNPANWTTQGANYYKNFSGTTLTGNITPSATTGSITMTSSVAEFVTGDIGRSIIAKESDGYYGVCTVTSLGGSSPNAVANCTVDTGHPLSNTTAVASGNWGFIDSTGGWSYYAFNADDIRAVIEAAATAGANIKAVINGHGHGNDTKTVNGINYYEIDGALLNSNGVSGMLLLEDDGTFRLAGTKAGQTTYNVFNYYVDGTSGNDYNFGVDRTNAWLTTTQARTVTSTAGGFSWTYLPGTYREQIDFDKPGVSGSPNTWNLDPGVKFSGANSFTGFTNGGSNVWYKTGITTEPKVVIFSGTTLGTHVANKAAVIAPNEWFWTATDVGDGANGLYVYAASSPTIEAGQRNYAARIPYASSSCNYIDINGGEFYGGNIADLTFSSTPANIRINNNPSYSTLLWGSVDGLYYNSATTDPITINRVHSTKNSNNGFYIKLTANAANTFWNYLMGDYNGASGLQAGLNSTDYVKPNIYNSDFNYNTTYGIDLYGTLCANISETLTPR
jgi:predicted phosphodiesterase